MVIPAMAPPSSSPRFPDSEVSGDKVFGTGAESRDGTGPQTKRTTDGGFYLCSNSMVVAEDRSNYLAKNNSLVKPAA